MPLSNLTTRLRQPEYTGENRCLPCTLVNAVIAVVLAGALATVRPALGALALAVAAGAIYLRGYLVPGTPELTKRYFPPWLLAAFGKAPPPGQAGANTNADAADARDARAADAGSGDTETLLAEAGVVEECAEEDDLCLTADFETAWWRHIRAVRGDETRAKAGLADSLGVDPEALAFETTEGHFAVTYEGDRIGRWPSRAVFYADLAAEPTLAEWVEGWAGLDERLRTEVLAGMRVFLSSCPACEADLEQVESVRESCCGGEVVTVSVDCPSCGARVFSGSHA